MSRRPAMLLAALTASACLSAPFTGMLPAQASAAPLPLDLAAGSAEAFELRSTTSDMWADDGLRISRARAALTEVAPAGFSDSLRPGRFGVVAADPAYGVPLTNMNLPLVAGEPLGDAAVLFSTPYVSPVPGPITSPYGPRFHPILNYVRNHNGVDMTAACGTPIVAMADGTVTRSASAGGYGLLVEIDHGTVDEDRMSSRYAHLSVLGVTVGQKVSKGQQIGLAGTTGLSTGCHLHFEVLINGSFVDPRAVLSGAPFVRLDTPMVPWVPGTKPKGPLPKVPPTEAGPLPDLIEVPLIPAKPTPTPTPTPTPDPVVTPDPTLPPGSEVTPSPSTPTTPKPDPVMPAPVPDPTTPAPDPDPTTPAPAPDPTTPAPAPDPTTPAPEPSPSPSPAPAPEPAPEPSPTPTPEVTPAAIAKPPVAASPNPPSAGAAPQPTASPTATTPSEG